MTIEGRDISYLLEKEVELVIKELAIKNQKLPEEPYIDRESGEIIPEQSGYIVDIPLTLSKVLSANEYESINIVKKKTKPTYTSEDIEKSNETIGYYKTGIHGSSDRIKNLKLASDAINNRLIWPNNIFSFNEIVGPRTPNRGYLPAPIIFKGETILDYGGGVCQIASTLYNAVTESELEIVERHTHSKPIGYVPVGKDATVYYGYKDLKFKNNKNNPIIVMSGIDQGYVWVKILGRGKNE
ncbi:VanW family protein [Candidatus Syntrophocurvum alkaliphilum]|uniref:VanW family protein n=1 Tax=Candidatus Syntrophocurvum alkaliphilum TaxID=2293317 RepID=UPI001FAADCD3|nr:VanW family protein [Candidatus Syntrophocurvum alkaliphilum]